MSPRDPMDRGTRIGHPTRSIATVTLAGLVLILTTLPPALHADDFTTLYAGEIWQQMWADDFEHSMNGDWTVRERGQAKLQVVPEDAAVDPRLGALRCDPPNNVLRGESPNRNPGHGFAASSPALEDLGILPEIETYRMSFTYEIIGAEFCWSIPLASPDATLVVSECTSDGTRAVLGTVDHEMKNFRRLTDFTVDEPHDFIVVVTPLTRAGERQVRVFLDGALIDEYVRTVRSPHRAMTLLELPAFPVDALDEYRNTQLTPACFGTSQWDNVSLSVVRSDGNGWNKRQVTIDPNPFNPSTSVCMELEASCWLEITIFDARGRRVRGVHAGVHPAGPVRLGWDGRDDQGRMVGSGVYYVRTAIPGDTHVTRAVLVR